MRKRNSCPTLSGVRSARDTVMALTPTRRATSCMVTRPARELLGLRTDIGPRIRVGSA
ncbi:hypothetical protein D3C72_2068370 [compost metagenome]